MSSDLRGVGMLRCARLFVSAVAVGACAFGLGGCASVSEKMSQSMSQLPAVGLPANAPERPAEARAFPAVHDMPPPRTTILMTAQEQREMERDLVVARTTQRNPQATPAAAAPAPAKPQTTANTRSSKPAADAAAKPRMVPASSSQTIY